MLLLVGIAFVSRLLLVGIGRGLGVMNLENSQNFQSFCA